jgi:hypothetical protein
MELGACLEPEARAKARVSREAAGTALHGTKPSPKHTVRVRSECIARKAYNGYRCRSCAA